jgi:hypothetical protein
LLRFPFLAAERGQNNADIKSERFHRQLEAILKSFFAAQAPGASHDVPVQLGNVLRRVNLYVPLQFIIGDVEGGDQLCSRQTYRRENCLRMCRTCNVSTANASRPDLECTRVRVADIKNALNTLSTTELNVLRLSDTPLAHRSLKNVNSPFTLSQTKYCETYISYFLTNRIFEMTLFDRSSSSQIYDDVNS